MKPMYKSLLHGLFYQYFIVCVSMVKNFMRKCQISGDLGSNRPVPFRLTPNIAEFISQTGVTGPLSAAMVSAARCFVQPRFKLGSLLKAILRDEYITWHKKV